MVLDMVSMKDHPGDVAHKPNTEMTKSPMVNLQ